ncbi:HAMP domain-containing sensor histidine kinase [Actinomadura hibisca]|uniref:HAMP domain-containing sensor histidine kinase n=1 Tax=Actinomadura hibisca TaxID=68565 RepID=UPI000831FE99|nr:HAMP domain-containing sensor histidine kinase [Actinomadura hibisca]
MTRRLPLRARLALLTAVAVALAVAACAVTGWVLTRDQLYGQLDRSLRSAPMGPPSSQWMALQVCSQEPVAGRRNPFGASQVVKADGGHCAVEGSQYVLTVTPADVEVARGVRTEALHDGTTADGTPMRILTRPMREADGAAVSIALPLDQVEGPLGTLALLLLLVSALGVLGAATAGLLIARAALRPVDELTGVVEHIARTEDLDTPIPAEGADEIARLSRSFNTMTAALAGARERQQQLIADAGHELRTPLTSLRTNIDLLLRSEETGRALPPADRRRLLVSVKAQMLELSSLVGDLLELARPDEREPARESVALHEVVGRAVERARLRGPGLRVEADAEPWFVLGDPPSLERAVVNLLDNAVKFSPPDGSVEVRLKGGELTVRDHGPGIPADELPHVFERFWRSPSARSLPGSGLGLSIVARVVEESGGEVSLEPADGGGVLARVRLPGSPVRGSDAP